MLVLLSNDDYVNVLNKLIPSYPDSEMLAVIINVFNDCTNQYQSPFGERDKLLAFYYSKTWLDSLIESVGVCCKS